MLVRRSKQKRFPHNPYHHFFFEIFPSQSVSIRSAFLFDFVASTRCRIAFKIPWIELLFLDTWSQFKQTLIAASPLFWAR